MNSDLFDIYALGYLYNSTENGIKSLEKIKTSGNRNHKIVEQIFHRSNMSNLAGKIWGFLKEGNNSLEELGREEVTKILMALSKN